ncbi:MAG TPA: PHP domain-containing protein [Jatrophihabitans sp.]|nr:PHP domain-containing protein [Jatrophihabitans sp.]
MIDRADTLIDLHCHSTASDGTDAPAQLVRNGALAGLTAMAITDHDTTGGWAEAAATVATLGTPFALIRGTEFSCLYRRAGEAAISLHVLGYLYDPQSPGLRSERARLRQSRLGRGEAIVAKLVEAGFPISWDRVRALADGGSVGRPHIGRALHEAGVVGSVDEAFSQLLSDDSPFYVQKDDSEVKAIIALIRQAGGVPVIAHPWARRRGPIIDERALVELLQAGLAGIEVDHPDHAAQDRLQLRDIAERHGALITGSSDYHGTNKSVLLGAEATDPHSLQRIVDLATGVPPLYSAPARHSGALGDGLPGE